MPSRLPKLITLMVMEGNICYLKQNLKLITTALSAETVGIENIIHVAVELSLSTPFFLRTLVKEGQRGPLEVDAPSRREDPEQSVGCRERFRASLGGKKQKAQPFHILKGGRIWGFAASGESTQAEEKGESKQVGGHRSPGW